MNNMHDETSDEMERELLLLKPRPATPQLRQRVEAALDRPIAAHRSYAPLALAASLLVAAALIGLLLSRQQASTVTPRIVQSPAAIDSSQPTLLAYRHALGQSEQEFVALPDAHGTARTASAAHLPASPSLSPFSPLEMLNLSPRPDVVPPRSHSSKDRS